MLKLPYTFLPPRIIAKGARLFYNHAKNIEPMVPSLEMSLRQTKIAMKPREYIAMCLFASLSFFLFICFVTTFVLFPIVGPKAFAASPVIALAISIFVFMQQIFYPQMLARKRVRSMEKNLLPATQNMLIQLNSGVPLFNILVNIAANDYGELSKEFEKAVKEINAGRHQVEVLEDLAETNPSLLFRRVVWQIANGMKAGSNMSTVIEEVISSLSEEQIIQIQNYGSKLNPIAMFYMLAAVIVPSLSITFIIILSSFISMEASGAKMLFWGLYGLVFFIQIMFIGVVKSRRPNLL